MIQYLTVTMELSGAGIESVEDINHVIGQMFSVGHDGTVNGKLRVVDVEDEIVTAIE